MKKILASVCLIICSLSANAAVVDFESAATSGLNVSAGGSTEGFTLSAYNGSVGGGFNSTLNTTYVDTAYSGNQYMMNYNSVAGEFSSDMGPITLESLWARTYNKTSATVNFYGLDELDNILYSLSAQVANWTKVSFLGWTGVTTLRWDPISPNVQNIAIDDLEYSKLSPVPVPAALWLFGSALLAFAGFSRKKKVS